MSPLFIGFLGGLFHFGGLAVHGFERSAAADLSSKLQGELRQVSVKAVIGPEVVWGDVFSVDVKASHFSTSSLPLFCEPKRSHRGWVRTLRLDLEDFSLASLHVERMSAEIPDCRFDLPLAVDHKRIRLSESGIGHGEVVVDERDLEQFLLTKYPEIKKVSVTIDRDKITAEGVGEFLIFRSTFTVIARVEIVDGHKLMLAHARLLLAGSLAGEAQQRAVLSTLNPVVDLDKDLALFGALQADRVELSNGHLRLTGSVVIPNLPPKL